MGMQHSDEIAEAASLLYQVLGTLGLDFFTCGYEFIDENVKERYRRLRNAARPLFEEVHLWLMLRLWKIGTMTLARTHGISR